MHPRSGLKQAPNSMLIMQNSFLPPVIAQHPFDQLVEVHFDVSLKCRAVGDNLVYHWTHNNNTITPNGHYIVKGSDLFIVNATMLDAGKYQCIATNRNVTNASNYATIIVASYGKFYMYSSMCIYIRAGWCTNFKDSAVFYKISWYNYLCSIWPAQIITFIVVMCLK